MRGRGRGRLAHTPTEIACLPVPELLGRFKTVAEADRPCKPTRPPAGSAATDRAKATLPILSAKSLFRGREVGAPSRSHLPATPTHLLPPQRNVRELCWAMTESTSRGTAVSPHGTGACAFCLHSFCRALAHGREDPQQEAFQGEVPLA